MYRFGRRDKSFWYAAVHTLLLLVLVTGCTLPQPVSNGPRPVETGTVDTIDTVAQRNTLPTEGKLQSYLQRLAVTDPTELLRVIVQYEGDPAAVRQLLAEHDALVINELTLIDALVVNATAATLSTLAAQPAIRWISLDAPVRKASATDGSSNNARDDFDGVAFNGSSGGLPWATDWQEIGENDGPDGGHVMVTAFWGGALHGLRLQGAAIGAQRTITLNEVQQGHLGVAYRRKDFQPEQDYVTIEFSLDGGSSWQQAARIDTGSTETGSTDDAIQYGDFDLPLSVSASTLLVRLVTAPTMSETASFYVDAIDLRLDFARPLAERLPNQIFLPLVAGGPADTTAEAVRTKEEILADAQADVQASWNICFFFCVSLNELESTYVKAIGADQLWNEFPYIRGNNVTVAVVDSGIAPHPDLKDYYGRSRVLAHVNFVPNSTVPDDFYGHGTHVAGTIAGSGESSNDAYKGVAPEANLVDVRVTDDYGMGNTSNVVAGLQWIYDNRAKYNIKVANLSLNSTIPESYHVSALDAALEVLWFNRITVVVSAGNQGKEKLYPPANDPFVITVGAMRDQGTATISDDQLATFSAYGLTSDGFVKPDLVAPGQDIVSLLASDDMTLKLTLPLNSITGYNNRYFKMSGTSMASAVVAGSVALLLEDEPTLTPDQVKYRLTATARPFTVSQGSCATGAGYLDIYAAVHGNSQNSANTHIPASQMLWSGANPINWNSVSWNSVSWNSVSWNSVSWNSVSWNSVSWNSVSWNSNDNGNGTSDESGCGVAFSNTTLINADTNQAVQSLFPNAIVDLDRLGTNLLTIRADVVGPINSVKFAIDGSSNTKIDSTAPYSLYGDTNGNYTGSAFPTGPHQLVLEGYGQSNAGGGLLARQELDLLVVNARYTPALRSVGTDRCMQGSRYSWDKGKSVSHSFCSMFNNEQRFRVKPVAGSQNIVNLVNVSNGYCLDVKNGATSNGADAIQQSCNGSTSQQWRLAATDNAAYSITAVHSGKCLEAKTGLFVNDVEQNPCQPGNTNQQWRLN